MRDQSNFSVHRSAAAYVICMGVLGLAVGSALASGDSGPRKYAEGAYDAATDTYTVIAGDDLSGIAERFGTTVGELEMLNRLTSDQILVGQKLVVAAAAGAAAQTDPLPSWNDGPARQAIIAFVQTTTDQSSPKFVPPAERIATFDQDGTLVGRAPHVLASDLLPGPGAGGREGKAGARERRAVQDRAIGRPRGHRQALHGRPCQDPRRDAHRHECRRVQSRGDRSGSKPPGIRAGIGPTPSSPTCPCRSC